MHNAVGSRIAAFFIALIIVTAARSAPAVEFNCAKAFLTVDYVICRSPQGMRAIGELQATWDSVYATTAPGRKAPLVRDQRAWIKAYAAECGAGGVGRAPPDPTGQTDACVVDHIERRTAELRAAAPGGYGGGRIPGAPVGADPVPWQANSFAPDPRRAGAGQYAETPVFGAPWPSAQAFTGDPRRLQRGGLTCAPAPVPAFPDSGSEAGPGAGGLNPINSFLHPPAGLRPLPIDTFEGRPILDGGRGTRPFLQLVALGINPEIIEQRSRERTPLEAGFISPAPTSNDHDEARDYAAEFLDPSNPLENLIGSDEIVSEQNRRTFLTQYGPVLRALAPRAPFEFAYVVKTFLPPYNSGRGGFPFEQIDGLQALNPGDLHGVSFAIPFDCRELSGQFSRTRRRASSPVCEASSVAGHFGGV